jgi:hypothetical protein
MPSNPSDPLLQALEAFGLERLSKDDLMRQLVSYRDWLAPTLIMAQHYGRSDFAEGRLFMFGERLSYPRSELWLFTDFEAASRAQEAGALLGPYVSGIGGTELFGKLDSAWDVVKINPGSTAAMTCDLARGGFEEAAAWADAINFEAELDRRAASGRVDLDALGDYRDFLLLNHTSSGLVATLPGRRGLTNPAPIFTAPDCLAAFLRQLTPSEQAGLVRVTAPGKLLLERLPRQGVDGMLLNEFGPGPSAVVSFARDLQAPGRRRLPANGSHGLGGMPDVAPSS